MLLQGKEETIGEDASGTGPDSYRSCEVGRGPGSEKIADISLAGEQVRSDVLIVVQKPGVYQFRLVVYPIIYRVLYIPGGAGFFPSTVVTC